MFPHLVSAFFILIFLAHFGTFILLLCITKSAQLISGKLKWLADATVTINMHAAALQIYCLFGASVCECARECVHQMQISTPLFILFAIVTSIVLKGKGT
jgi:hypothetical protein